MNDPEQKRSRILEEEFLRHGTTFKISQALNDKVKRRMDCWVGARVQYINDTVNEAIKNSMKQHEEPQ